VEVADLPLLADIEVDLWRGLIVEDQRTPSRQGEAGHPLVAPARRWRGSLLASGAPDSTIQEADEVLAELGRRRRATWRERNQAQGLGLDSGAWFGRLRVTERLAYGSLDPGGPSGSEDEEEFEAARAALRAGFERALQAAPPGEAQRVLWTDQLVDAADEALTGVDDLSPEHATRLLDGLAADLDWHLAAVETEDGLSRRRLVRRRRRLAAEATERHLTQRLEGLFGARRVALWEQGILLAILAVLVLMVAPLFVTLTPTGERNLLLFDSSLCALFLWDFFVRWTLTRGNLGWFRRHVLTDLLPALPFPLLFLDSVGGGTVAGMTAQDGRAALLLRLLRLSRLARYSRLLLPLLRAARAVGFLLRGLDRLVRRYGRGLDFDVILHPTPEERRQARARAKSPQAAYWRLLSQVEALWTRTLQTCSPADRRPVAEARQVALAEAADLPWQPPDGEGRRALARTDVCADDWLDRMSGLAAGSIEGELGSDFVGRLAGAARGLARSPLRWLPLLRAYVPRAPDGLPDAELCARLVRGTASRMRAHLDRWRWGADLYGTMTPPDLVGQVGAALVKRTARPVMRLLLLGAAYLGLVVLFRLFRLNELDWQVMGRSFAQWSRVVGDLMGTALFLVAGVCLVLLAFGYWMQRVARDASTYYAQVASAQFLHMTESIKVRHLGRDGELFAARVLGPERTLDGRPPDLEAERRAFLAGVHSLLVEGQPLERSTRGFDPVARAVLLYRDVLDGALLAETDTRTTSQLLGNLALKRIRGRSWRISAADDRALDKLDLVHRRALLGGPWLWFNLIARATTQQTARLIVDYNEQAVPLEELEVAAPEVLLRYRAWLRSRGARPADLLTESGARQGQLTTAFTALHFLDDGAERDAAIGARFGPEVLELMRQDRRALIRRVFGTFPLHLRPTEQRVLNPRDVYRRWIEGGRVVFLPLRLIWLGLRRAGGAVGFVGRALRSIRDPSLAYAGDQRAQSDFTTASRKIDRMRGPAAMACTWQRILADVEYLGLALPGGAEAPGSDTPPAEVPVAETPVERDLAFLNAPPATRERAARETARAARDMRRLEVELEGGLWERVSTRAGVELPRTGARLRALVVAYRADYHGLRTHLACHEVIGEVLGAAALEPALAPRVLPRWKLRRAFLAWWEQHGQTERLARLRAWRAVEHDVDGVARALLAWHGLGRDGAQREGEAALAEVLRHPGQITEQIVTLRAVQTLALIDLRNYREHIWRLGGFEADGDSPGRSFEIPS
jgi:hypothetical protein